MGTAFVYHSKDKDDVNQGINLMKLSMESFEQLIAGSHISCIFVLVNAYLVAGFYDEGISVCEQAIVTMEKYKIDGMCGRGELYRLLALLLWKKGKKTNEINLVYIESLLNKAVEENQKLELKFMELKTWNVFAEILLDGLQLEITRSKVTEQLQQLVNVIETNESSLIVQNSIGYIQSL